MKVQSIESCKTHTKEKHMSNMRKLLLKIELLKTKITHTIW